MSVASRGPVPKRSIERRRRNKESQPDTIVMDGDVVVPDPDPAWHPRALALFEAIKESGQAVFYEPSDWQAVLYLMDVVTLNLNAGKFSAELFKGIWQGLADLGVTESARRRLRMEIERDPPGEPPADASVTRLDAVRARAGA